MTSPKEDIMQEVRSCCNSLTLFDFNMITSEEIFDKNYKNWLLSLETLLAFIMVEYLYYKLINEN